MYYHCSKPSRAEDGFSKQYDKPDRYRSALLQVYRRRKVRLTFLLGFIHSPVYLRAARLLWTEHFLKGVL